MESAKPSSPCWKKKAPDAGLLANVKDHFEQFVSTSMDQHRICLKKAIQGLRDYTKLKKQNKVIASSTGDSLSVTQARSSSGVHVVTS